MFQGQRERARVDSTYVLSTLSLCLCLFMWQNHEIIQTVRSILGSENVLSRVIHLDNYRLVPSCHLSHGTLSVTTKVKVL